MGEVRRNWFFSVERALRISFRGNHEKRTSRLLTWVYNRTVLLIHFIRDSPSHRKNGRRSSIFSWFVAARARVSTPPTSTAMHAESLNSISFDCSWKSMKKPPEWTRRMPRWMLIAFWVTLSSANWPSKSRKMSRNDEQFFAFHSYRNELSRVIERLNHVIEDTHDFWKFVQKYEEVERKKGAKPATKDSAGSTKTVGKLDTLTIKKLRNRRCIERILSS